MKRRFVSNDNKYIEWLENNMNHYDLFYFKESESEEGIIECFFKDDDTKFAKFYKKIIEEILIGENNP